jgi:hypothetical protein
MAHLLLDSILNPYNTYSIKIITLYIGRHSHVKKVQPVRTSDYHV